MGYFLVYILKSGFCLILFYLFYRLFLSRETFFRFNRVILLGFVLLSFLLPFIQLKTEQPTLIQQQAIDIETLLLMANEIDSEPYSISPYAVFILIYLSGLLFFLLYMIRSVLRIRKIISEARSMNRSGLPLWLTTQEIAPFSWMRNIIMSEKDWQENGEEIYTHEKAHITAGHAYDLIAVNLCAVFQWFNPAIWLFKQELQSLHEYQADEAVIKQGVDAKKYQLLLIKKAVGSQRFISVANSFNQSNLKNRITMMLKGKSNPWRKLKYVGILPLAAVAVATFARPEVSNELEKLSSVKITEIIPEIKTTLDQPEFDVLTAGSQQEPRKSQKSQKKKNKDSVSIATKGIPDDVVYVIDGERAAADILNEIEPDRIERVDVLKKPTADFVERYDLKGGQGVVLITTHRGYKTEYDRQDNTLDDFYSALKNEAKQPIMIVDGEYYDEEKHGKIDPSKIASMSIFKGEKIKEKYGADAEAKYGPKLKNGVIEIELKK